MSVTYRTLRAHEVDAAVDLWTDILNDGDRTESQRMFEDGGNDPDPLARTYVAVASDGTLLSTAQYWLRERRDVTGTPHRLGHVFNVATRPEARRQGHGGKLLAVLAEGMRRDGCSWGLLWAREEAISVYQRAGWRTYPRIWRGGYLTGERPPVTVPYIVRPYEPAWDSDDWQSLANVYTAYNVSRPFTLVRDRGYWQGTWGVTQRRWHEEERGTLWTAERPGSVPSVGGYLVAQFFADGFNLVEIGVLPDDEAALAALLCAVVDRYADQRAGALVQLPDDPQLAALLTCLFGASLQQFEAMWGTMMARPIAADWDYERIAAMVAAPGAVSWRMDEI